MLIPIPRFLYERLLGLAKGAGHKYLKKVPAGVDPRTGKPRFRYYYKVTSGQGHVAHEDDLVKVGASFMLNDGEHKGHVHVVNVEGDHVTLRHDESGREFTLTARELKLRLHRQHARAIVDQRKKARDARMREFEQAKKTGSPKQQERAKERAKAAGASVEEKKPKPPTAKPDRKPPTPREPAAGLDRIEAVGDHIWGSRKDLASLGELRSSKDLEGMSYADAAAIVTKAKLVSPLSKASAQQLGMSPGAAYLFMAMLGAVRQKPGDNAKERAAFVDEVREIQGAMLRLKTAGEVNALIAAMYRRSQDAPKWEKVTGRLASSTEANAEAVRLARDNPGQEYRWTMNLEVVVKTAKPYEVLGRNFVKFLKDNRGLFSQSDTVKRAVALDASGEAAGWEWLEASTAESKAEVEKKPRKKAETNTTRGFSEAQDVNEVRRVGGTAVDDADPARVKTTFGLREVDYGQGGWMTQADREYHTKALEGGLHDLADALGLPPELVSFKGRLGVALGARGKGKAVAHYEPGRHAINITKLRGGGSLAHEWGHALDNIVAEHFISSTAASGAMLTATPEHSALPAEVRTKLGAVRDAMLRHPDPAAARRAYDERLAALERTRDELVRKSNDLARDHNALFDRTSEAELPAAIARAESLVAKFSDELANTKQTTAQAEFTRAKRDAWARKLAQLREPGAARTAADDARMADLKGQVERMRGEINKAIKAYNDARRMSWSSSEFAVNAQGLGDYWARPWEMFARAFESFVHDRLKGMGRENTYLVADWKAQEDPAYPKGAERERINTAMGEFLDVLKASGTLHKAFARLAARAGGRA